MYNRRPVYLDSSEAKEHNFKLQTNDVPQSDNTSKEGYISMQEVGQHHLAHDAWVVVNGKVYE